jgi:hypothetical protein
MNNLEEQLGKDGNINLTLLKQLLSEDKKLPRSWLKMITEKFISITSTIHPS